MQLICTFMYIERQAERLDLEGGSETTQVKVGCRNVIKKSIVPDISNNGGGSLNLIYSSPYFCN